MLKMSRYTAKYLVIIAIIQMFSFTKKQKLLNFLKKFAFGG